jgi:hypothetical protein
MKSDPIVAGETFANLTEVRFSHRNKHGQVHLFYRCTCGKEITAGRNNVRQGHVRSCGCLRGKIQKERYDKIREESWPGVRYGNLVVLKAFEAEKCTRLICRCDCGKETTVRASSVKNGNTRSCGCLAVAEMKSRALKDNGAAINQVYRTYVANAKKRKYQFELSLEELKIIIERECIYCGTENSNELKWLATNYKYNGIDRVHNSKGYTKDNVVTCCRICNIAKHTLSVEEFRAWLLRAASYQAQRADGGTTHQTVA